MVNAFYFIRKRYALVELLYYTIFSFSDTLITHNSQNNGLKAVLGDTSIFDYIDALLSLLIDKNCKRIKHLLN